MISAQGGDPDAPLPVATDTHEVTAEEDGVMTEMDALAVGVASWRLGAGRARQQDPVQAGAGIEIHAVPGDTITKGQKLFTLHTDTPDRFDRALDSLRGGYTIDPRAAEGTGARKDIVLDRIS